MSLNILSLDMATLTGWAVGFSADRSGVKKFDVPRGASPGTRFLRMTRWLMQTIRTYNIELVVYEMPHQRGGAATEIALGFAATVQQVCAHLGIEHYAVRADTVKIFATGKGKASKEEMMVQCAAKLGLVAEDDNHSDALWILAWAKDYFAKLDSVKVAHKLIPT